MFVEDYLKDYVRGWRSVDVLFRRGGDGLGISKFESNATCRFMSGQAINLRKVHLTGQTP